MRALATAAVLAAVALSGCLAPRPETVARNWRPTGAGGPNLGQLLAVSPGLVGATWESYDGPTGEPVVRLAAEYAPAVAGKGCPSPGAGGRCGFDVTAHISCRKPQRTETGELEMGEVLTHASTVLKNLKNGSGNVGSGCVKFEIRMNARSEVESGFKN